MCIRGRWSTRWGEFGTKRRAESWPTIQCDLFSILQEASSLLCTPCGYDRCDRKRRASHPIPSHPVTKPSPAWCTAVISSIRGVEDLHLPLQPLAAAWTDRWATLNTPSSHVAGPPGGPTITTPSHHRHLTPLTTPSPAQHHPPHLRAICNPQLCVLQDHLSIHPRMQPRASLTIADAPVPSLSNPVTASPPSSISS